MSTEMARTEEGNIEKEGCSGTGAVELARERGKDVSKFTAQVSCTSVK